MKISMKITGEDVLNKNIQTYAKQMDIGVQYAMEQVIEKIVTKATIKAPKDTGKLKASITGVVRQMTVDVYTGHIEAAVNYAKIIEFGSSTHKAQPFLTPVIEECIEDLKKEIQEAHKRATKRLR